MTLTYDMTFKNTGLYVEGRFFEHHYEWAKAFALGLAQEYNRLVEVLDVNPAATPIATTVFSATPFDPELAVAA